MQLMIDALKEAAWPGTDQRTLVVLASSRGPVTERSRGVRPIGLAGR